MREGNGFRIQGWAGGVCCTVYTVHCEDCDYFYSVQGTAYTLQCTMRILEVVQCTMHSVLFAQCGLWPLLCSLYIVECIFNGVHYSVHCVSCTVYRALERCVISYVKCIVLYSVQPLLSDVLCTEV